MLLALAALFAAGMHGWFAYKETMGWTREFVEIAAPSWIKGVERGLADKHIDWARQLARNVGAYNLMLAVGLAWTSYALFQQSTIGRSLAIFFGIWLLVAAAAALYTKVFPAAIGQGFFGLLLIVLAVFFS
jgi:uncharacterized membrane protein